MKKRDLLSGLTLLSAVLAAVSCAAGLVGDRSPKRRKAKKALHAHKSHSVHVIGGADGPTAVFVSHQLAPHALFYIAAGILELAAALGVFVGHLQKRFFQKV